MARMQVATWRRAGLGLFLAAAGVHATAFADGPLSSARPTAVIPARSTGGTVDDQGRDVRKPSTDSAGQPLPNLAVTPDELASPAGNVTSPAPVRPPGNSFRQPPLRRRAPESYFSLNHRGGDQFGQAHPDTAISMFLPLETGDGLWFAGPQFAVDNDGRFGTGFSIGRRWLNEPLERTFGIAVSLDAYRTRIGEMAPQSVLSLESRGLAWDVFANGYLPVNERQRVSDEFALGQLSFRGANLTADVIRNLETSMSGCDLQVARRLGDANAWGFGGWYHFEGGGESTDGVLAGLRGYPGRRVALDTTVSHDNLFGTNVGFSATVFLGGPLDRAGSNANRSLSARDRLSEPLVRRDTSIQYERPAVTGSQVLTQGGMPLTFAHVNSSGVPGNGTIEMPFGSLTAAVGSPADVVLMQGGSVFNGQSFILQPGQQLLADNGAFAQTVMTDQLGVTPLPRTSAAGAAAIIAGAPGAAVTMSPDSTLRGVQILNAAGPGIVADTSGAVLIDRVNVTNSAGPGLLVQVAGANQLNATVTGSVFTANAQPTSFLFGPNAGAILNVQAAGNEDSQGFALQRDANGFLRLVGPLGTGGLFNDDNGNLAALGNTTSGGAPNVLITGAGNQIEIIPNGAVLLP